MMKIQTELADWQQMPESWNTNTNLKLTQAAAAPYTGHTLPTKSTVQAADDVSTMAEPWTAAATAAISWQHHWAMQKKCYLWDFQEAQSEQH